MRHLLLVTVLAACGSAKPPSPSNSAPAELTIDERGLGPIDAKTPAELEVLQRLFPKLQLRLDGDGSMAEQSGGRLAGGVSFQAYAGDEQLFYVVPYEDRSVYFVQATSSKVRVAGRPWLVGGKADHKSIDECECWGAKVTCFKTGEHVAIAIDHDCKGMRWATRTVALDVIDGSKIERIVWSPRPFKKEAREKFPEDED